MKRRWFLIVGLFLLFSPIALLVAFGIPPLFEPGTAAFVLMPLAGFLFALGGSGSRFGGLEWYQFVGAAQIFVGISFAVMILLPIVNGTSTYESAVLPFMVVAAIGGAASTVFIGADWIRGGHHFDLSIYEPGPIFTSARQ